MADYTVQTTLELKNGQFNIPNLQSGQTIETSGYYTANDGGGATFTVRAKETGETPDNYFTFAAVNNDTLIVALDIPNGIVNVDQLGAKGDAVLPGSYTDTVTTIAECNTRTEATLDANQHATDNKPYFQAAVDFAGVREIRLTPGKVYGIKTSIAISSNKKLNGCGATIMNICAVTPTVHSSNIFMLKVKGTAASFAHDIEICNLRLIGNCRMDESLITFDENQKPKPQFMFDDVKETSQGIYIQYAEGVHIHDVQIERFGHGIHTTTGTGSDMNRIHISHVQIRNGVMGIQFNYVQNSQIKNSEISVDYTMLTTQTKYNHCIYVDQHLENCTFSKLKLCNSNGGYAIILKGGAAGSGSDVHKCKNLHIHDVDVDACATAVGTGLYVENIFVEHVAATRLRRAGILLNGVKNAVYANCTFLSDLSNPGGIFAVDEKGGFEISEDNYGAYPNKLVKNITIRNCVFDFRRIILSVGQNRVDNCEGIRINDCTFKIHDPQLNEKTTPAYIKGIIKDIRFTGCRFEAEGFSGESSSRSGVLFWFSSTLAQASDDHSAIPNKMHWFFDKCTFVNNGSTTLSSLMLSDGRYDIHHTVYCCVRNCVIEGFRWITRISYGATENIAEYDQENDIYRINPCFSGIDEEKCIDATILMNQTGRFTSKGNLYRRRDASYGNELRYSYAEEYGI